MQIKSFAFPIILLLIGSLLLSYTPPSETTTLLSEIDKLKRDTLMSHGTLGVCIIDLKSGKILLEENSDKALAPASTLKVSTTAAALEILGEDFRFETSLYYDGKIKDGVLKGNIIIVGGGDPTLDSPYFKSKNDSSVISIFVARIKKAGIKKIEGNIYADASIFEEDEIVPQSWIWADMGNYFGAGASGLTFMENEYILHLKSGQNAGDSTWINKIEPAIPGMQIINNIRAGGVGDNAMIFGAPYQIQRIATGTITPGQQNFKISGSIPDPPYFFAYSLSQELKKNAVEVEGDPFNLFHVQYSFNKNEKQLIYKHKSPALNKIIYWTNFKSHNLFAEHLLKMIGHKVAGKGTTLAGLEAIVAYWHSKGINMNGSYFADGSGLSRLNAISTKQQALMLVKASKESYWPTIINSFPEHFNGKVKTKSGYITRARGYTGVIFTDSGKQLAFSVVVNNYDYNAASMRRKMEKLMELMIKL